MALQTVHFIALSRFSRVNLSSIAKLYIDCLVFQEHIGVANHHYSWAIKSQKVTELNSSLFSSYDDKEQHDCQLNRLLESGKRAHKMALP